MTDRTFTVRGGLTRYVLRPSGRKISSEEAQ